MNPREEKSLCKEVRALWEQGLDTFAMSIALQLDEHEIERQLHVALDRRRAVVANLGGQSCADA